MNRDHFRALLRDALNNIHDPVVLEKHPLNDLVPRPNLSVRRSENLQQFLWDGIDALKPRNQRIQPDSLEWRYYLILSGRYIEGASIAELQRRLSLGERQERRLHGRAFAALEEVLWYRLFPGDKTGPSLSEDGLPQPGENTLDSSAEDTRDVASFPVTIEPLQLARVLQETSVLFLPQLQAHGGDLSIHIPSNLPLVEADRIILRQILLLLFHRILQSWAGDEVFIQARSNHNAVTLEILSLADPSILPSEDVLQSNKLLVYWLERMNAHLFFDIIEDPEAYFLEPDTFLQIRYALELPLANQAKILVVDDHEAAIRIIQRYLSQVNIQVIGVTDPSQVLPTAQNLYPKAVLLDVMMPSIDGWEILQKLKSDPETSQIPVIICSVWDQPELAYSLGANAFLKKPIMQAELFDELARLSLLDTSDESLPTDS